MYSIAKIRPRLSVATVPGMLYQESILFPLDRRPQDRVKADPAQTAESANKYFSIKKDKLNFYNKTASHRDRTFYTTTPFPPTEHFHISQYSSATPRLGGKSTVIM